MCTRLGSLAGWMLPLVLCTSACSRDLDLPAAPPPGTGGAITGRMVVEDSTGAKLPVAGRVELLRRSDRVNATDEGLFVLIPPQETWQALFRAGCDDATKVCDKQKLVSSADLPLVAGVDLSLGDVLLSSNGDARGRIVLADAPEGLAGGGITVYVPGSPFRTVTGDDGSFKLPYLPEGTMTVAAFLAGYDPAAVPGVKIAAGTTTSLADITLTPAVAGDAKGSISGKEGVVKKDGSSGTVTLTLLRGADLIQVGDPQTKNTGESFVFAGLPYGFYALTAEVSGYGRTVVNSILLTEAPVAQPNAELGELTIDEQVFEEPATGAGTTTTVVACKQPKAQRGPCLTSTDPPAGGVLSPLGVITVHVDEPLKAGSEGAVLRPDAGEEVPADVVSPVVVEKISGDVHFAVRPRQPLPVGLWTLSLSPETRDADGKPPAGSFVTARWLVAGFHVGPGFVRGADPFTGDDLQLPLLPSIASVGDAADVTYRGGLDGDQYAYVAHVTEGGQATSQKPTSQTSANAFPRPGATNLDGDLAIFAVRDCDTPGDAPYELPVHTVTEDGVISLNPVLKPPCGDEGAIADGGSGATLFAATVRQIDNSVVVLHDDGGRQSGKFTLSYKPVKVEVARVGSQRFVAVQDSNHRLHVLEFTGAALNEVPGVDSLTGSDSAPGFSICSAGGKLLLLFAGSGGSFGAYVRSGSSWVAISEPLLQTSQPRDVACRSVGDAPFVVATEAEGQDLGRVLASYLRVDTDKPEQSHWVRLTSDDADGALNAAGSGCPADPGVAIGSDPDGSILVAWSTSAVAGGPALCDGFSHVLEMARIR